MRDGVVVVGRLVQVDVLSACVDGSSVWRRCCGRGGDGHLRELFGGGPPAEPVGRGGLEPGQGEPPRAGEHHRSLAALVNTHTAGDHQTHPDCHID